MNSSNEKIISHTNLTILDQILSLFDLSIHTLNETTLKSAYRKLLFKYHPDHNRGENASEIYTVIQDSYKFLQERIADKVIQGRELTTYENEYKNTSELFGAPMSSNSNLNRIRNDTHLFNQFYDSNQLQDSSYNKYEEWLYEFDTQLNQTKLPTIHNSAELNYQFKNNRRKIGQLEKSQIQNYCEPFNAISSTTTKSSSQCNYLDSTEMSDYNDHNCADIRQAYALSDISENDFRIKSDSIPSYDVYKSDYITNTPTMLPTEEQGVIEAQRLADQELQDMIRRYNINEQDAAIYKHYNQLNNLLT